QLVAAAPDEQRADGGVDLVDEGVQLLVGIGELEGAVGFRDVAVERPGRGVDQRHRSPPRETGCDLQLDGTLSPLVVECNRYGRLDTLRVPDQPLAGGDRRQVVA